MVIASIFIGYYLSMTILLRRNKTENRNKMYQALLMGFWMGLLEMLMAIIMIGLVPLFIIILFILIIGVAILTWLIYNQKGINQNQFMLSMIEHHEMAIEMVKQVKPKLNDVRVKNIAQEIEQSQQKQIDELYNILKDKKVPNNISSLLY